MLGGLVAIACGGSPSAPSAVESPAPASYETDARSPPASRLEAETILAFGDSLTEGIVKLPTSARFSPSALSARVSVSRHT